MRKALRIALLFNGRPTAVATPDDRYEEYDTPETIAAVTEALESFGDVERVEAGRDLARRLDDGQFDFAFNIAEGRGHRCREAHAAAVCEMLDLPFTHSDPLTLSLALDKMMARRVVSPDVPVAPAVLVNAVDDVHQLSSFPYPAVVKPNDEGSSKGVRDGCVAVDASHARVLLEYLRESYGCPVLVEQYLPGAELTVGITGNSGNTRILGVMEIAPADPNGHFLYSVEAKRAFRDRVRYFIPPRLPEEIIREVEEKALTAYRLLGCRDIARLDFRLDAKGQPHFLECNPLPGLNPETSDIGILSRPAMSYAQLVRGVLIDAAERCGVNLL